MSRNEEANPPASPARVFTGRVTAGRGEAAMFTRLEWVRARFVDEFGIDPYPGTLNLTLDTAVDRDGWLALRSGPGIPIDPPSDQFCQARCYPVRVARAPQAGANPAGWLPAGIVVPDVPGYPASQVELIAAVPVRELLSLADGDRVVVEACAPLAVRAVIFDVDGTLVDSLPAFRVVAEQAAAPYGLSITDAVVREALNTTRPFWDLVLPADQVDRAAAMQALTIEAARLWPEVLGEHGRVFPAVGDLLATLRARGASLAIVTGSRPTSLEPLRQAGLLDLFACVVTASDVHRRKPDPEGLVKCAAALGVEPGQAVYVGDTPLDVQAARAAGMFAVGVLGGAGDSARLTACGPDRLVASAGRVLDVLKFEHVSTLESRGSDSSAARIDS